MNLKKTMHHESHCFGSNSDFLSSLIKLSATHSNTGRTKHPVFCYVSMLMSNKRDIYEAQTRQREFGYADVIRDAGDHFHRIEPLWGFLLVVCLYPLLPLVSRLVNDSRIRHSNVSLLMDGLALSLGVRDENNRISGES